MKFSNHHEKEKDSSHINEQNHRQLHLGSEGTNQMWSLQNRFTLLSPGSSTAQKHWIKNPEQSGIT